MTIHFLHDIRDGMRQWTWRLCSQTVFFLWTDCRTQFFFIQSGHFSKAIVSMFHLGCSWPNWAALWATFSWPFSTWQLSFSLLHILLLPRQPLLLLSCVFLLPALHQRVFPRWRVAEDRGPSAQGLSCRHNTRADTGKYRWSTKSHFPQMTAEACPVSHVLLRLGFPVCGNNNEENLWPTDQLSSCLSDVTNFTMLWKLILFTVSLRGKVPN